MARRGVGVVDVGVFKVRKDDRKECVCTEKGVRVRCIKVCGSIPVQWV